LSLSGSAAKVIDGSGGSALANFDTNTGSFSLASGARVTTRGGDFSNPGSFDVGKGSKFTIGGSGFNYTQAGGSTTGDGKLDDAAMLAQQPCKPISSTVWLG
jgi:hypothetical protein